MKVIFHRKQLVQQKYSTTLMDDKHPTTNDKQQAIKSGVYPTLKSSFKKSFEWAVSALKITLYVVTKHCTCT